jgi:site-specific recombinase XerD
LGTSLVIEQPKKMEDEVIVISSKPRSRSGKVKLGMMDYDPTDPVCLYLEELTEKSQITMYRCIRMFSIWFYSNESVMPEHVRWSDVTYGDVKAYQNYLRYKHNDESNTRTKPLSVDTQNLYLTAVRNVMKKASRLSMVAPVKKVVIETYLEVLEIKMLTGTRISTSRALDQGEVMTYLSSCNEIKGPNKRSRDVALFLTMINCGLRMEETFTMSYPDNVDLKAKEVRIIGKGNKERIIPLNDVTAIALTEYISKVLGDEPGLLWLPINKSDKINKNKSLSANGIRYILKQRGICGEIKSFKPHDLRRTFGTRLLELGVDVFTVQDLLGHASSNTTKRYDMRGSETKVEAVKLL